MRSVIFANGWLDRLPTLFPDDLILAADGGALYCLQYGLRPAAVIGDLDSLTREHLEALKSLGADIIQYPTRKDFTDLELAILYAQEHGANPVILVGALGGRWDQTLANLLLPAAFPDLDLRLIDGSQEIIFLRPGHRRIITGHPGDTVSLIPLAGDVAGITTAGLEYPLVAEMLRFGATRGVSNVLLLSQAEVSLESGLLACVIVHQED